MRNMALALLAVTIAIAGCGQAPPTFQTLRSDSFVIHYPQGHEEAAQDVLRVLDASHARILSALRPDKTGPFTVRIYPNLKEFHQAINKPGSPDWVVGSAWGDSELRMVSPSNPGRTKDYDGMLEVAVHELAHCMTNRLAAGKSTRRSVWLWESIALYMAGQFRDPDQLAYMRTGQFPRFLSVVDQTVDTEIYSIGFTVLEFIVETWNMEAVRQLVTSSGNISRVLGLTDDEFYTAWYEFVQTKYLD